MQLKQQDTSVSCSPLNSASRVCLELRNLACAKDPQELCSQISKGCSWSLSIEKDSTSMRKTISKQWILASFCLFLVMFFSFFPQEGHYNSQDNKPPFTQVLRGARLLFKHRAHESQSLQLLRRSDWEWWSCFVWTIANKFARRQCHGVRAVNRSAYSKHVQKSSDVRSQSLPHGRCEMPCHALRICKWKFFGRATKMCSGPSLQLVLETTFVFCCNSMLRLKNTRNMHQNTWNPVRAFQATTSQLEHVHYNVCFFGMTARLNESVIWMRYCQLQRLSVL